jgi:hypothetical protein
MHQFEKKIHQSALWDTPRRFENPKLPDGARHHVSYRLSVRFHHMELRELRNCGDGITMTLHLIGLDA